MTPRSLLTTSLRARPRAFARVVAATAALVASLVACSKPATTESTPTAASSSPVAAAASPPAAPHAPSPTSAAPAWLTAADRAPLYGKIARRERTGPGRKPTKLAEIDELLERMTKQPETAEGVREAARMLDDGAKLGRDPSFTGSGTSPGATLLHHGGMAVLIDLTQRACAAKPGDKAIGAAADTAPLPLMFNSAGRDQDRVEQDRHILQEAAQKCGSTPRP